VVLTARYLSAFRFELPEGPSWASHFETG
jgi:hypothetical protein